MIRPLFLPLTLLALGAGCAPGFTQLYPGMTAPQVVQTMGSGPTRVELFPENYSAWYYGQNYCLLMQNNVLVTKQQTEQRRVMDMIIVEVTEKVRPQCVPPGMIHPPERERSIHTPIGRFDVQNPPQGQATHTE